jgi:hypothetical protein
VKWFWLVLGAFGVYYLIKDPAGASHLVHQAVGWLSGAAHSLATFANSL